MTTPTRRTALLLLAGTAAIAAVPASLAISAAPAAGSGRIRRPRSSRQLVDAVGRAHDDDRIELVAGMTYTLPRGLQLSARRVLLDGAGAMVRLGDSAGRRDDRLLSVSGQHNVVRNVHFAQRPHRADGSPLSWSVQVMGVANTVDGCRVTTRSATAIGVAAGRDHVLIRNTVTGGGMLLYSWADARGTRCEDNTVLHARGDAISGVGNDGRGRLAQGHRVARNRIRWCARFGIEDWGTISGTVIADNDLRDVALTGISAVGGASVVRGNRLRNAGRDTGIETGASGTLVEGNEVVWDEGRPGSGTATGVIVNSRWTHGDAARYQGLTSRGNRVEQAGVGLDLYGDLPGVLSEDDVFVDCRQRAVDVEPRTIAGFRLVGARIDFRTPSSTGTELRDGVVVAGTEAVRIERTTIRFAHGSAGGGAADYFVRLETDRVAITGCVFDGGGRTDRHRPILGNASARIVDSATLTGDRFIGGARLQPGKIAGNSRLEDVRFS